MKNGTKNRQASTLCLEADGENLSVFCVTKTVDQEPFAKWPLDAPVYKHIIGTAQAGKEVAVFQKYVAVLTECEMVFRQYAGVPAFLSGFCCRTSVLMAFAV